MLIGPIELPAGTPVDIYNAAGITVGTQLRIQILLTRDRVYFYDTAAIPIDSSPYNTFNQSEFLENKSGDLGCWAESATGATIVVEEV